MSRSFRSIIGTAAFVLALLFTAAGAGQYWFVHWQLHQETKSDLWDSAEDMRDQIAFAETWNLQGYRRTTEGPDIYLVMAENGTLIDTHGYLRGMLSRVSVPFRFEYDRPVRFASDVGETWNLYVHKLGDGLVILGARVEITPERVNELFVSNAARFGASVADALRTPERAIHEAFDYAVVDKNGILVWAIGGSPLKASPPYIPAHPTLAPVRQISGKMYAALLYPVLSKSHRAAGVISVFEDVTDDQRVLRQSAVFNGVVASLLWVLTVGFSAAYLRRARPSAISCAQIPFLDEGETVEFKSSLRWDYVKQRPTKEVERSIIKAVVGFLNSENGGTLVIGISDAKEVLGLEADYASFRSVKRDWDGFEQMLRQILINAVGERRCARWVKTRFCSLQGRELCLVIVSPSSDPVFLEEEGSGQLYVRVGNSTRPFGVQEALAYARDRWGGLAL
jgi:Putative DNA-binding domain